MAKLEGATQTGAENAYPSDPGEFAARWNEWTTQRRVEFLRAIESSAVRAGRCFEADHEGRLHAHAMTAACPARGPSDQDCIGRGYWHEVHSDGIGTTWRDWAGKKPGVKP